MTWLYRQDGYRLDHGIVADRAGAIDVVPPAGLSDGCYANGTVVTLTARPAPGDRFTWWHGDVADTDRQSATVTVTMDGPRRLRADFQCGWTYDPVARRITDGNWVLGVSVDASNALSVVSVKSVGSEASLNLRTPVSDSAGNGYPIRSIGGFGNRQGLLSVVLPDGLGTIADDAFSDCHALESVSPFLPSGLTRLGSRVFSRCEKLTGPLVCSNPGLKTIGAYAFQGTAIASADLPHVEIVRDSAFTGAPNLESVRFPALVALGESAFQDCPSLVTADPLLPDTLVEIGRRAFFKCPRLAGSLVCRNPACKTIWEWTFTGTSIAAADLPYVETIAGFAFQQCASLAEISIPSLRELGGCAFEACENLVSVVPFLPDSLTTVADQAFAHCPGLGGDLVGRNPGLKKIGATAFYGTAIRRVDLPFVEVLGAEAFQECRSIEEARIPAIVTLGEWSFKQCASMAKITLSDSLTTIRKEAFNGCETLSDISPFLPDSVDSIGDSAFYNCVKLPPVLRIDGAECTSLPHNAFCKCKSLESVRLDHVETLVSVCFHECSALTNVVFSPSLKVIGRAAFERCSALKMLELPKGVESIGERAFHDCISLARVSPFLPDSLATLGVRAFDNCPALEGPLCLNNPAMTNFNNRSFRGTPRLSEVRFPAQAANLSVADSLFYNSGEASRYYFPKFAPKLPVDNEVFSYRSGKRSTIYGSLRCDPEGWAALATDLTDADLAAPRLSGQEDLRRLHRPVDEDAPLACRLAFPARVPCDDPHVALIRLPFRLVRRPVGRRTFCFAGPRSSSPSDVGWGRQGASRQLLSSVLSLVVR